MTKFTTTIAAAVAMLTIAGTAHAELVTMDVLSVNRDAGVITLEDGAVYTGARPTAIAEFLKGDLVWIWYAMEGENRTVRWIVGDPSVTCSDYELEMLLRAVRAAGD